MRKQSPTLIKPFELNAEKADAYYNRGLAKFRLGDLESIQGDTEEARRLYEAGADFEKAKELAPNVGQQ